MIATFVGEKSKLEDDLAAVNFASTRLGRASDKLRSIFIDGVGE